MLLSHHCTLTCHTEIINTLFGYPLHTDSIVSRTSWVDRLIGCDGSQFSDSLNDTISLEEKIFFTVDSMSTKKNPQPAQVPGIISTG
mmetsp:Transcript_7676/g.28781  ORF Transcript_7676/g.28781 Transcript_7676/m.28781 type:complete len:87 (+) Transcript_7676:292-552(+)